MSGVIEGLSADAPDVDLPTSPAPDLARLLVPRSSQAPRMATPREYLDHADGQDALESLYKAAIGSFVPAGRGMVGVEHLLTLDRNGKPTAISQSAPGDTRGMHAAIPNDAQAIVHSHPASAQMVPSPQDYLTATKVNKPNFILSRNALYVAMPGTDPNTSKHTKVADVIAGKGGRLNIRWTGN
jgi:hypothetical protein